MTKGPIRIVRSKIRPLTETVPAAVLLASIELSDGITLEKQESDGGVQWRVLQREILIGWLWRESSSGCWFARGIHSGASVETNSNRGKVIKSLVLKYDAGHRFR